MSAEQNSSAKLLDRCEAAEILVTSVRTVDRLIKKGAISSVRSGRDLFVVEESLLKFQAEGKNRKGRPSKAPKSFVSDFAEVHHAQVVEQSMPTEKEEEKPKEAKETEIYPIGYHLEQGIYKKLFEEGEQELKTVRQKLEMAHYRIGSLESQVKSMVPLIEFKKQKEEILSLAAENKTKKKDLQQMQKQLQMEQFVKKLYAGFLFLMLALVPLLVILRLIA